MTIFVDLKAYNLKMGDRLEEYVISKAEKVDKYINAVDEVVVELRHAENARNVADRYKAQITLHGKGFVLRSEESAEDVTIAFDEAFTHLKRRIERYKGRRFRGRGDGKTLASEVLAELETAIELTDIDIADGEIVRRKKLTLIPMDELEAMEQSNLLGYEDFFIFYNIETNSVNVLYMRKDEKYGLIETEIG